MEKCIIAISFFCIVLVQSQIPQNCRKINSCVCVDEHNRVVNLTTLASSHTPRFKDYPTAGTDNNKYSWNPCSNFNEGPTDGGCIGVGACKVTQSGVYTSLGTADTVEFSHDDNGNLSLVMTQRHGDKEIATHVILYCDQDKEAHFRVIGEIVPGVYWLQLWSKYNCPRLVSENGERTMPPMPDPSHMTMPSPGVMTSAPSDDTERLKSIEIILFCTMILISLILVVLLTKYTIKLSKGSNISVRYSRLPNHDPDILI